AVSDIPFNGPISEVRVAKIDGQLRINPLLSDLENATLEFIVAGTADDIVMVEGEAKEISEEEMVEAIAFAHDMIKKQVQAQVELAQLAGKTAKREYSHEPSSPELREKIYAATYERVYAVAKSGLPKHERSEQFKAIATEFNEEYIASLEGEVDEDTEFLLKKYFHEVE